MVSVLVILDGGSEPVRAGRPTSLERARTPALDALAAGGELSRLETSPPGLPVGSEVAIAVLLGQVPKGRVARGPLEAAACGIDVPAGATAWRVDVVERGRRAGARGTAAAADALRAAAPGHMVHRLAGHRLLVVGRGRLPDAVSAPAYVVWPDGEILPPCLGPETVFVAARGAAAGVACTLGARVVVPDGATGGPDSDLAAKAASARAAIDAGIERVVIHVGGADEAAHLRDPDLKVAVLERADRELIAPLAQAVATAGGELRVCPDHGCDPVTGEHDGAPVPCLTASTDATDAADAAVVGAGERRLFGIGTRYRSSVSPQAGTASNSRRLTERAVTDCPLITLTGADRPLLGLTRTEVAA